MIIPKNIIDKFEKKDIPINISNDDIKHKAQQELINKIHIENEALENQYDCCMGNTTDKRILDFIAKFLIIFSILCFSFVMVVSTNDSSERNIFIIIINTILSIFLPSPSIKDKDKSNK